MNPADLSGFQKLIAPIARRVRNSIARAIVRAVADDLDRQEVDLDLLKDEHIPGIERFQNYGITSVPHPGAEAAVVFVMGDRGHGIALSVEDRRYRLKGLRAGEVALYDDLGQKVHLTRDGIVIEGAGLPITIRDTPKVRLETDRLEVTGDIVDRCDDQEQSMESMRLIYDSHTHGGVQPGASNTAVPNQEM